MQTIKPCPFCGSKKHMVGTYYESTDGRVDRASFVKCEKCGATVSLTFADENKLKREYNYKGGYYSSCKGLIDAFNSEPIDKWNRRV